MKPLWKLLRRIHRKTRRYIVSRQAEVYLLSYPKCGRTWLRMLLGQLLSTHYGRSFSDPMDLWTVTGKLSGVPRIRVTHDDKPHRRAPEEQKTYKIDYAEKRVILLVRDPRDAMVSNYNHNKYRGRVFDGSLGEYLRRPRGGLDSLLAFYNVWARQRDLPKNFLLVRYEDLHKAPRETLVGVADFIGIGPVSDESIDKAIEESSFEKMRKIEASGSYKEQRLRPGNPGDERSFKTRKGQAGGYKDVLSVDDLRYVERRIAEMLDPYYESYIYAETD